MRSSAIAILPYHETLLFNWQAADLDVHSFSANNAFDPDVSGVGHQPRGWDQIVGVRYEQWRVLSSRIVLTIVGSTIDERDTIRMLMYGPIRSTQNVPITYNDWMETTSVYKKLVRQQRGKQGTLTVGYSDYSFWHGQTNTMERTGSGNNSLAAPGQLDWWFAMTSGDAGAGSCTVAIKVYYKILFTQPKPVAQS